MEIHICQNYSKQELTKGNNYMSRNKAIDKKN